MIRVLVLDSDTDGVGFYRLLMPHTCLKDNPEVKVDIRLLMDSTLQLLNPDFLKYYSIIVYNKNIPFANEQIEMSFYNLCQQLNIKIVYDLDDFWKLDPTHLNYKNWIKSRSGEKTEEMIKKADVITTTTSLFANDILPLNKNVTVLKNAINMEEQQWVSNKYPSDRIRFIWGGGISHIVDLRLLKDEFKKFDKNFLEKAQFYMCGYDLRIKMNDGSIRKDDHNRSQWGVFEDIFSNGGKYIKSVAYREFLKNSSNFDDDPLYGRREEFMNEFYQRRHTKPILHFGTMYNEADVSIAPLKNNHSFNYHKCIAGNSLISTNNGIFKIKDIYDNKLNISTEIKGEFNKIINYFKYEKQPTIKITTKNGYQIEGTDNHRILIDDEWVELKDIKIGDQIKLTIPQIFQKEYQKIVYPMLLTKNITNDKIEKCDENSLPKITITEKWGRFLGYMLGDGYFSGSGISISCDKRHTETVNDVKNLLISFGLNPSSYDKKPDKRCKNSLIKEGFGVDIKSTCVTFAKIARKYNWVNEKGKLFEVPKIILESPKSVIKEFLVGLFESDGSVRCNGINLCSKSLKLIQQVQYLLLVFNIQSKIYHNYNKHYRKYYYSLELGRNSTDVFHKEINFVSLDKRNKLQCICDKKHSNALKLNTFNDIVEQIEFNTNDVYDIEIENVHCYNANGIISHNSELKLIEAGVHKMPCIMSDYGPYQLNDVEGKNGGKQKGWLIDERKGNWYDKMKWYVNNPNAVKEHGEANYEYFLENFEMKVVNKQRVELYKHIANQERGNVKL